MDMNGEMRISASREEVWAALNDPEVLQACIPGCTSLEATSDGGFKAKVTVKVGPVKAKFTGQVTLSDMDPPNGYTISGEGKGGPVGFAKGSAKVSLAEDQGATVLSYQVNATVGGKLAQLGSRLIDATARKYADDFFSTFNDLVTRAVPAEDEAKEDIAVEPVAPPATPKAAPPETPLAPPPAAETPEVVETEGLPAWLWVLGLIVAVAAGLWFFR